MTKIRPSIPTLEEAKFSLRQKCEYDTIWRGKIGKDCVSLNSTLAKWLSKRLTHLSLYTNTTPVDLSSEAWKEQLAWAAVCLHNFYLAKSGKISETTEQHTIIIVEAKAALNWVAEHLNNLWD